MVEAATSACALRNSPHKFVKQVSGSLDLLYCGEKLVNGVIHELIIVVIVCVVKFYAVNVTEQ
jgi:hypothetical protein